jgi:hypothetical protein
MASAVMNSVTARNVAVRMLRDRTFPNLMALPADSTDTGAASFLDELDTGVAAPTQLGSFVNGRLLRRAFRTSAP